jgi:Ca2+/Na+ antiporter
VFSSLGVMYGSLIYLLTYIVSLGCVIEQRIDVKKMNWHLTEVNAFLLFLAFAPTSFSNYMEERQASDENAIIMENLIDRIEELERTQ